MEKNESLKLNSSSLGYWETIHINDLCIYIKDFIENLYILFQIVIFI